MGNRKSVAKNVWKKVFGFKIGDSVKVIVPAVELFTSYLQSYQGNTGVIENITREREGLYVVRIIRTDGMLGQITHHIFIDEKYLELI